MSQFFKALEQAERDRLREEEAEAPSATPVTRTTRREQETPPPPEPVPTATKAIAPQPPAPDVVVHKAAAPAPAEPTLRAAKPVETKPAEPASSVGKAAASQSAPVFRASLRTLERPRFLGRVNGRPPALVAQSDPTCVAAEAYRTVRANIELMSENGAVRHIAITSAAGGDGKSTTAANLAVVAAQGGRRVCLVDADLRRPAVHDIFGLPNVGGLVAAIEHGKPLHTVAKPTDIPNLSIVVAGCGPKETFHDVLTSQRLESILRESEAAYDLVLFDSPPVLSADALSVAAACGGVILVVRAGSIPFSVLRRAIGQVTQVKGRVLGVLLNQVDLRRTEAGSYGYYRAYHKS